MNQFDMSFIHNGVHIVNPTLSEDGREVVSPSYYGFTIEPTGGGFTAWVKRIDEGVLVISDDRGFTHELVDSFMMGLFDGSENEGTWGKCLGICDMNVGVFAGVSA